MDGSPVKAEDSADHRKSGYKSWKKKYRKMRIVFDKKMQQGEDLHRQEDKASATVKRLAVENDRLLDLLLDVNNSPQIPLDKRIDVSLKPSPGAKILLPIDSKHATRQEFAIKKLQQLLEDIPHSSYASARDSKRSYIGDLAAPEGESFPASFLSADDIDNYIYDVDSSIDPETHIPTLAPRAHPGAHPIQHAHLKNPTSVTNWLRKHAPKIFLQDGEAHDGDDEGQPGHHTGGRKTRGSRGERGGGRGRGKRGNLASRMADRERERDRDRGEWDASMDEDQDFGTPVGTRGKRKRDDDPGYRPGGSAGRPVKKKRKSDMDGTPAARKSKKETAAPRED
ncbi:hypothetical protein NOR_06293 [Metarhizium rileyi]|uniref:Uncharacterized protein n=1 Tax=Metarhizium rileyi (strain RCEF 4871) TaxID=1649241 RepID=A0A167AYD9_METRR|nr:hypothetical protein NOR_06293 [Metarhizium rileyi RCEF 4871]TWU79252.1 hypothetical protein ED733_009024 [Metarhizium rileyi]